MILYIETLTAFYVRLTL